MRPATHPALVLFVALSLMPFREVSGQKGSANMFGSVVDRMTQGPIPNARIIHGGDGRIVIADSLGFYQFPELRAGIVRFSVRAVGYPTVTFTVALTNGERMERDIELDAPKASDSTQTAQTLAGVEVEAPAPLGRRFADFERRKAQGRGHYLTRTQIEALGANSLQDALRGLRGVAVECSGGAGCYVRMVRAPMRCLPEYIVDERVDNEFGPFVAVRDIEAVEVYTGPSDVPGEFAGRNSGCGVVVIWTKSGPPRRK
jgi:Carboxypeptidase regulatory-like domain